MKPLNLIVIFFLNILKTMKKFNLPSKICAKCDRPFIWRKKWKNVWNEVKYCSERCKREKNS
ncbi:MAG: DUF2256 domain-containing protein [Amylibacter sp.]